MRREIYVAQKDTVGAREHYVCKLTLSSSFFPLGHTNFMRDIIGNAPHKRIRRIKGFYWNSQDLRKRDTSCRNNNRLSLFTIPLFLQSSMHDYHAINRDLLSLIVVIIFKGKRKCHDRIQ